MSGSITVKHSVGTLLRWLTYNSVGVMGTGVQLATLMTLIEALDLNYLVATAIAVETAILHNFVWHERWTWGDRVGGRASGRWRRLAWFNLVSGTLSISGNVVLTGVYVTAFDVHYAVANLMAIASCSLLTFLANDRFVFRRVGAPETRPCVPGSWTA